MTSAAAPFLRKSNARWRLREATQATHERMHLLPQFRAIEAGQLDRQGYMRLLTALLAYHSAIARVAGEAGLGALSSSARRCEHLERDLQFVGGTHSTLDRQELDGAADRAIVLGSLYVAEGSMLGGRVIARQLDYLFAGEPKGRSFFIGTRDDDTHWRQLLAALDASNDSEKTLQAMISGAEASFAHFGRCIGMYG